MHSEIINNYMVEHSVRAGVYVHVALCRSKCIYCDFYSEVCRESFDWQRYIAAMLAEFDSRKHELEGKSEITLYIGGGTPSLIPVDIFGQLIGRIKEMIYKVTGQSRIIETTMEVNPDDVSEERVLAWKDAGVNRVSMGVQSLVDSELRSIGRRHDARTALRAYEILSGIFNNVSLDLMFGLPGQTVASLGKTIDAFVDMHPQHISAYSLMYEERTALTRMRDAGRIEEADEDLSVGMFRMINDRLKDAGYMRYEISNYALPGRESKHNSAYWDGTPYIGIGPSAHSFDGMRSRRWNVADINKYMVGIENKEKFYEMEILSETEIREEFIMTSLRTIKGIELESYETLFGAKAKNQLLDKVDKMIKNGLLECKSGCLRLTDSGVMVSDEIIVELF